MSGTHRLRNSATANRLETLAGLLTLSCSTPTLGELTTRDSVGAPQEGQLQEVQRIHTRGFYHASKGP